MSLEHQVFAVIDTETTGLDPQQHELVEIACVMTSLRRPNLGLWTTLVKPTAPIPPEASAIHGITDRDVEHAPSAQTALNELERFLGRYWDHNGEFFVPVAHNADFDEGFLPRVERREKWLCSKRLSQHLWPNESSHRNQTLRYSRRLPVDTMGFPPHRALGDALVTATLLRDLLCCAEFDSTGIDDAEQLIEYAESPITILTWPFGKFFAKPIEAADVGYIQWALENAERVKTDRDLKSTLEAELTKRKAAA